jgi:hypothetical protein
MKAKNGYGYAHRHAVHSSHVCPLTSSPRRLSPVPCVQCVNNKEYPLKDGDVIHIGETTINVGTMETLGTRWTGPHSQPTAHPHPPLSSPIRLLCADRVDPVPVETVPSHTGPDYSSAEIPTIRSWASGRLRGAAALQALKDRRQAHLQLIAAHQSQSQSALTQSSADVGNADGSPAAGNGSSNGTSAAELEARGAAGDETGDGEVSRTGADAKGGSDPTQDSSGEAPPPVVYDEDAIKALTPEQAKEALLAKQKECTVSETMRCEAMRCAERGGGGGGR